MDWNAVAGWNALHGLAFPSVSIISEPAGCGSVHANGEVHLKFSLGILLLVRLLICLLVLLLICLPILLLPIPGYRRAIVIHPMHMV